MISTRNFVLPLKVFCLGTLSGVGEGRLLRAGEQRKVKGGKERGFYVAECRCCCCLVSFREPREIKVKSCRGFIFTCINKWRLTMN